MHGGNSHVGKKNNNTEKGGEKKSFHVGNRHEREKQQRREGSRVHAYNESEILPELKRVWDRGGYSTKRSERVQRRDETNYTNEGGRWKNGKSRVYQE